jgi:hypothetical protein
MSDAPIVPPAPPPPPPILPTPGAAAPPPGASPAGPSKFAGVLGAARFHASRAFRPRWDAGVATPAERALLATPRPNARTVPGAEAQDYVAWRRSLSVVALWTLALTTLVSLVLLVVELAELEAGQGINTGLYGFLSIVRFVGTEAFPLWMLWLAVRGWHDLRWSHRRLMWGWAAALVVTFGLALFPMGWLIRAEAGADPAAVDLMRRGIGMIFGIQYLLFLLPAVLSVLVGAIRSSMAVKSFLPEAALPGWLAAAAAPVLALLILVLAAFFAQLGTNVLVVLAALAMTAKYLLPLWHARRVAKPHTRAELEATLRPLRIQGRVLGGVGGVLLVAAVLTMDIFGVPLVGTGEAKLMHPFRVLHLVLDFTAKAIMAAIVFSDWIMAVLRFAWSETNAFRASAASPVFEARIHQLEQAGIGTLRSKRPVPEDSAA